MAKNTAMRNLKVVSGDRPAASPQVLKSRAPVEPLQSAPIPEQTVAKDHFVERNGVKFAGTHLLIELWGAKHLGDSARTEAALREGAVTAGATILHCHLHHFGPNAGLSGVLVLAESHISITPGPSANTRRSTCSCAACATPTRRSRRSSALSNPPRCRSSKAAAA
jgi:S-adenosylmethionine decarboxylase